MSRVALALLVVCVGCTEARGKRKKRGPEDTAASSTLADTTPGHTTVSMVTDEGVTSGYEDAWFGHFNRGRGAAAADFDGDGDMDVFSTNPAGESFLIRNVTEPGGPLRFEPGQVLSYDALIFSPAVGDWDNDGDPDLYLATGGNDGYALDQLYRNDLDLGADPAEPFVHVADMTPLDADGEPVPTGTMSAIWFDADSDGLLDVFANFNIMNPFLVPYLIPADGEGLNQLWRNLGDGTFEDVAVASGLTALLSTRNSDVLDFDGDGDLDLYENNYVGANILWRNLLVETGALSFEDVTAAASLGGSDLSWPQLSSAMCSIAADLDNDGWDDIVTFRRWPKDPGEPEVHTTGHLLWMNVGGTGFVEVGSYSNLDIFIYRDHGGQGVMGCQIADLDLDGFPDIFVGNGGPEGGERNQLFVSSRLEEVEIDGVGTVRVPLFEDWTGFIDFAPTDDHRHDPVGNDNPYPYRTHGSMFADFDGDGVDELAVHNGGPGYWGGEEMQEPNRLYRFTLEPMPHWLRVQLVGDGTTTTRDAIGARVRLRVGRSSDGATWDLYKTRKSTSGFGAQNAPYLVFGLGDADEIHELEVQWPDGRVTLTDLDVIDQIVTIEQFEASPD